MGRLGSLEALKGLELVAGDVERRAARRARHERLQENLSLLKPEDRLLLRMYLEAGSSLDELARVARMDRSTICRRIHRLIRRLGDETYARCACDPAAFSAAELVVIRDHFVRGLSVARIGRDHRLCRYRVCAILQKARRCAGAA